MERTKPRKGVKLTLEQLKERMPEKRVMFCYEYVSNGWNAPEAYRKVYGAVAKTTSYTNGRMLLKNTFIVQMIALIRDDYENTLNISKQRQIKEYSKLAYSSVKNLYDSWIELKDWDAIIAENPEALDAVEMIDSKTVKTVNAFKELVEVEYIRVKMHDKIKALEKIDTLMGYNKPVEITVDSRVSNTIDFSNTTPDEMKTLLEIARKTNLYDIK